jgi:hypothetical protein
MPITYIPWLAGAVLAALLLALLRRWARSLPVAHAWNPETHDRLACVALEVLRAQDRLSEPVTLFGWVLRQLADSRHGLWDEYIGQIRRGAIEEDMNSHAINEFEAVSALADVALAAGAILLTPWLAAVLAIKKLGGWGLEQVEGISGANGGYHYYNPMHGDDSTAGLSEPTYIAQVLSKASAAIGSGSLKAPMPSAVTRALDPKASDPWSFDYEDRNYTYDDAQRYLRMGYPALGFYALGRVLHLLQDMAVPAHVRDDSHLGIDLPAPYGKLDWATTSPPGDPNASNTVKWSYQQRRTYATVGSNLYADALGEYRRLRAGSRGAAPRQHFYELASWSHQAYYCLGTIPGNPDAHDPMDTKVQPWWRNGAPVDWSRCAPNVQGFCTKLGFVVQDAKDVLESHQRTMALYGQQLQTYSVGSQDMSTMRSQIMVEEVLGEELLATIARELAPHIETVSDSHDRFVHVVEVLCPLAKQMNALSDPNPQFGPFSPSSWKHPRFLEFQAQVEAMDLDRLLMVAKGATATVEALRTYIRGFGDDEKRLAKAFDPAMPFIITPEMYMQQYRQTTPRAAARCAALMADWFESLYAPGQNQGTGVWQNADPANGVIPTEYRVDTSTDATPTKTYGVANHLPVPLDMTCEFTLVDLTDANTGASVTDREVSVDVILGHVSPAHFGDVPTIRDPASPIKAGELNIRGRSDQSVVMGHRQARSFTFGSAPHAFGTQRTYQWPAKGTWGAGAIRREEETEKLKPVNLTPGQAPGGVAQATRDDMFATFLRLSAKLKPKEEEQF